MGTSVYCDFQDGEESPVDFGDYAEGHVLHPAELGVRARLRQEGSAEVRSGVRADACALHAGAAFDWVWANGSGQPGFQDVLAEPFAAVGGEDTRGA